MVTVRFYDEPGAVFYKYAVIIAAYQGKYIFCKHRERSTFEIPGGHWEPGEEIDETAKRELYEETGAVEFSIQRVCAYSVSDSSRNEGQETFGMLYFAQVNALEPELHSEIEFVIYENTLPSELTYPFIQPALFEECSRRGFLPNPPSVQSM